MTTQPDTYQRILESAKELFYASGYTEVGVAAICEKAGVKKGSFYHFFPSKQELTLVVIDTYFSDLKDAIIDNVLKVSSPVERLKKFFEMAFQMQSDLFTQTGHVLGCPFGNLATELSTRDEIIRKKIEQVFFRLQNILRDTLKEAVDRGELENIDIDATAQAMFAYFEGIMLLAKTSNNPQLVQQLLPAASQILIKSAQ